MPAARHALLIGINRYPKIPNADLQGAVSDMELMRSVLIDRFGFPAEQTRSLRDKEGTQAAIRGALADLAAAAGEDDVVILYIEECASASGRSVHESQDSGEESALVKQDAHVPERLPWLPPKRRSPAPVSPSGSPPEIPQEADLPPGNPCTALATSLPP